MRIVFCGSGSFAAPSLEAILKTDHEVVGVITQPPRRAGRGGKLRATLIAEQARRADLDVIAPQNVNSDEAIDAVTQMRPDIICVVEFGQMIRREVRCLAPLDIFNLHGSVLPELRGAAPVNWAIIRGYKRTGVTSFSLVDRMDAGPVYLTGQLDILAGERGDSLRLRLARLGAGVVCRTIDLLAGGEASPVEQDDSSATAAPRLTKSDGIIDWTASAETAVDLVHGTWPWPGAQAVFAPKEGRLCPVVIARAAVASGAEDGPPGTISSSLAINTGRGMLEVREIRPAGKRMMPWGDFVNGYRAGVGDCFIAEGAGGDA